MLQLAHVASEPRPDTRHFVTVAAALAPVRSSWIHNVYPRAILTVVKDAGIRIRVEKSLRASFAAACQAENKQASDVLREFMEVYVAQHQGGQGDLFSDRREEGRLGRADSGAPST